MPTPCYEKVIYGPSAGDAEPDPVENVIIPLTDHHKLRSTVVYGEDGVTVKYIENHFSMEAILALQYLEGSPDNLEDEVERIRNILNTPRLSLVLHPVGLGTIGSVYDVAGGPLPIDVFVEPVASNNAILIRWNVTFRSIECASLTINKLIEYSVQQTMNIDDDGDMVIDADIVYVRSDPIMDVTIYNDLVDILVQRAGKSFQGMKTSKKVSLSRDSRTLTINLRHKEIKSDNAYYPNTSTIDAEDSLESSLLGSDVYSGKGFYTWKRIITGNIKLPARVHKAYAWSIMLKIIRSRFKKLYPFSKLAAVSDVTAPAGMPNNADEDKEEFRYLPLSIRIKESIYSRKMSFSVSFLVVTDLDNLLNTTKIMQRVNTAFVGSEELSSPKPLSEQWKNWQDAKNNNLTGKFGYTNDGLPSSYDQCSGIVLDHKVGPNLLLPDEEDPDEGEGQPSSGDDELTSEETARDMVYPEETYGDDYLEAGLSWVKYDNDFEIINKSNLVPVHYLEQPSANYYRDLDAAYANRGRVGLTLNGRGTGGNEAQTNPTTSIARGHSKIYVRMVGHAIRVKHKIPIPTIVSIGGKIATRVSNGSSQKQISQGDIPVYLAKWDVVYMVEGGDIYSDDILNSIVSTGLPAHYQ